MAFPRWLGGVSSCALAPGLCPAVGFLSGNLIQGIVNPGQLFTSLALSGMSPAGNVVWKEVDVNHYPVGNFTSSLSI